MGWGVDEDEIEEAEEQDEETSVEEAMMPDTDEEDDEEMSSDGGWGDDVSDATEEEDDTEEADTFLDKFRLAVADNDMKSVSVAELEDSYKEIEDTEILEKAKEQDDRSSAEDVYERRLGQLQEDDMGNSDSDSPGEEDEQQSFTEESNETQDSQENASQNEEEEDTDESETSDEGWGTDLDETEEEESVEEIEDVGIDNLAEEPTSDGTSEEEDEETTEVSAPAGESEDIGYMEDISVGSAMTGKEASEEPYLWRILAWGPPGYGKTHYGFTMPAPVCVIDTEGKAHNLASKFSDKVTYIWQPEDYDEARDALFEAIEVLEKYLEKGHRGTLVVDSMSEMWEWSKQKYVSKVYDGKSLDEVNLSSNMGRSGESDWKVIKRYHNKRFREVMLDTPFHIYWTAMQTDDYERIIEGEDGNPKKPVGERDNDYKVEQVMRLIEGPKGKPVGQLQKSGSFTKHRYTGLTYPTFQKHQQVCEEIRELEDNNEDPMLAQVFDGEVSVVEGNPERYDD